MMVDGWRMQFRKDLLDIQTQVAQSLSVLYSVHHQARLHGPQADAMIAGFRGAERREIFPIDYNAYRLAELQVIGQRELERFQMELRLEEKSREYDMKYDTAKKFATRKVDEVETLRKKLADLHRFIHDVEHSRLPDPVKKEQLADLANTVRGLRNELRERLGLEPDDEAVDRPDV